MKKIKGKLLQIAELGQKIIRQKSKTVTEVDDNIKNLIQDLIATCQELDGVGIASPQVYEALRLFILASHPSKRYPKAPKMKPTPIINPKIKSFSKQTIKDWEGCLSIPGIRGNIPRYKSIKVTYTTVDGKKISKTFRSFVARIFQHEFDHINGQVFLDRLESMEDIITEKEYQKLIKKSK